MALLRNYTRLWTRATRLYSTELHSAMEFASPLRENGRRTPRLLRLQSNLKLNDFLRANKSIKDEDWAGIRQDLLESSEFNITERTIDMAIVHLCLDNKSRDTALEYLQYLWDGDGEMNLSSMISYLKLCYASEVNETQMKYVLSIYNKIREKYPVMDSVTAECCIMAITQTERWKESFELMDIIKLSCKPRSFPYTVIITAAFNNNEADIGWKYLREILVRLNPDHHVYTAYLNYCTRNFKGAELEEEVTKMFRLWGDMDIRPYVDVITEYEKILEANGWSVSRTSIRESGGCSNCNYELSALKVSPNQYKKLTDAVRERVLIGHDVYRKTTPEELTRFLQFIDRTKPYDIVIDGLNVSYLKNAKYKPDGLQLNNVVKICVNMGKKVLVLGRKHMLKWPKLNINFITENGSFFLADNSSADDPYLLYATLVRGPNTQFVSNDLMRQHKFLIEDWELTKIFKYWQMAHQFYPMAVMTNRGMQMQLKKPPRYLPVAQKDDKGWHVPFTFDPSLQPALVYEPPESWVCFRKNPSNSTKGV